MENKRCLAFALLALFGTLFLHGCGGSDETTITTTATTSTSTTSTTTTSVTTVTGFNGCLGKPISDLQIVYKGKENKGLGCFCFYAGHCLDYYLHNCWNISHGIDWCQKRMCGMAPFTYNTNFLSFYNIEQKWDDPNPDVLTIPQIWILNINHLKDTCNDTGVEQIARQLQQGREDFAKVGLGVPQWQCFHVQRWVGVEWLHLHTFNDRVKAEQLPASVYPFNPPHALCTSGVSDVYVAAKTMIDNIPHNPGMTYEQSIVEEDHIYKDMPSVMGGDAFYEDVSKPVEAGFEEVV